METQKHTPDDVYGPEMDEDRPKEPESRIPERTPGPWIAEVDIKGGTMEIRAARSRYILAVARGFADAHLIAAAPDLLAALELGIALMECIEGNDFLNEHEAAFATAARAAIAKARGE